MIYQNILELIGNTPIVKYHTESNNAVYLKLEKFNAGGSIKDRIALQMIEDLEQSGQLIGKTIVEATSGNTGVGLAFVCASKKIPLIVFMPEGSSQERSDIMKAYGAQVIFTKKELGMKGAIQEALSLSQDQKYFYIEQFKNKSNPKAHYQKTAQEIINDFPDGLDYIVTGIGTSGTLNGLYHNLKEHFPNLKFIAVEPLESNVLVGGIPSPHRISGIGAGFVPEFFIQDGVEVIDISQDEALSMTKTLAKQGYLVGISSAAAILAALQIDQKETNKKILVICPDGGERYMSTGVYN